MQVVREAAEFIDLYFQDNVPSWRSPDIWVDWPGDNPDPAVPRVYPEGTPTDQGEIVRFPAPAWSRTSSSCGRTTRATCTPRT